MVQHPTDEEAVQTDLSQPWLLVHCLGGGWGCCKGAVLISQGSRSQLHSTNDLFNAWQSGAGLKERCQLCSCLWDPALSVWLAPPWFWTQCHREPDRHREADSATEIKVSSDWVAVNHRAFMWNPLTWAFFFFFALPWNYPGHVPFLLILGYPTQSTILSQLLWTFSLPFYTLPAAARVLFRKAFILTFCPSTFQTPSCLLIDIQFPDHGVWGLSQSNLHPHPGLVPPSPFISFISDSIHTGVPTIRWMNPFLPMLFLHPWRRHFCASPLGEMLPILESPTQISPSWNLSIHL